MTHEELKTARLAMKLTQAQLAGLLGLRANSIAMMERGERPIMRVTELAITALNQSACWSYPLRLDAVPIYPRRDGQYLHRVIYEQINGPIPDGLEIYHTCENTRCINPAHLEAVTHAVNVKRAAHQWTRHK